jgi:hypothetical protein
MSNDQSDGKKKIIVDEDWKSQVQAEKEATGKEHEPAETGQKPDSEEELPPPSLSFLASTLYLQGAIAMGLLPNPVSDKPGVKLDQARHAIDLLEMLQQKTEGNRTPDESAEIEEMLHQLRMAFVTVNQK